LYGLINKAVQGYLQENYGKAVWDQVAESAGISSAGFVSLETYPDELTYSLVTQAADILAVSADEILEGLGDYWISFTAYEGYGDFLARHNHNMIEFIEQLNAMHVRLMLIHPKMRIPKFSLEKISSTVYDLHYFSERQGLAPMLKGLLHGLSRKFKQEVHIIQLKSQPAEQGVHEVFRIELVSS
jgi:hypothetical protein